MSAYRIAVAGLALALAQPYSAFAGDVRVTGDTPFDGCTAGAAPGAVLYPNAEVEPYFAINPVDPRNRIGVWQQDRWSDGGSRGLVAGVTFNGGSTWTRVPLPFTVCTAGGLGYERASDPWVSFGPDGRAYAISISFNGTNNANAVGASVSNDGGRTWSAPVAIIRNDEPTTQYFNDKESITADPLQRGVAYAVWDRLENPNGNPRANLHTAAFRGPTFFSKTTDGGLTWSNPKIIVSTAARQQTIGNQIVVDRQNGALYNFFNLISPPFNVTASKVAFVKSFDGGATWTAPRVIAQMRTVGVVHPNAPQLDVRTGDIIPEPAIDPVTGRLYVVWQDSRFSLGAFDEVAISWSADGGATWSPPARVNTPTGRPAFTPTVRAAGNGSVAVTYFDFRNLVGQTDTLPTDTWLTVSNNGGQTFGSETRLTRPSFDMLRAPYAVGFFIGDYMGLDAIGTAYVAFSVRTNSTPANPTDVFASQ